MEKDNNIYQLEPERQKKAKMARQKKENKGRKKLRMGTMIFLAVFIYIAVFFSYQGFQVFRLRQEEKELLKKIELLEKEKAEYEAELNNVHSEEYIENFARENLRMVKENEILYVPKKDSESQEKEESEEQPEEQLQEKE